MNTNWKDSVLKVVGQVLADGARLGVSSIVGKGIENAGKRVFGLDKKEEAEEEEVEDDEETTGDFGGGLRNFLGKGDS